jgi:hypothetical protein
VINKPAHQIASLVAVALAAAVLDGGCAHQPGGHVSSTSSTSAVTSSKGNAALPTAGARALARRFAAAYARYLDGRLAISRLPATTAVRGETGPRIPRAMRRGAITVRAVSLIAGPQPLFSVELEDRAHAFLATLTAARERGSWEIVGLAAPDLDSVLHSGRAAAIRRPAPEAVAERAAAAFLTGYLPWSYARATLAQVHDLTGALRSRLAAAPPSVPARSKALVPRVIVIAINRVGRNWEAYATVVDREATFDVTVVMSEFHGRWLASQVLEPH